MTYDNKESGLSSTDVQGAIDELYGVCTAEPPAGNQIIEDNGLEKDPYECRYFFTGANPNNYITFNGETAGWRIISVGCDGTIKIMKTATIGDIVWDTKPYNDKWARPASLNTYLNGTYLNSLSNEAQGQIVASNYSIGAVIYRGNSIDLVNQVNDENSITWNGKIALPTASEYIRTNSNSNCKTFDACSSNYDICSNTTWMFNGDYWWTLSPYSNLNSTYFGVLSVLTNGDLEPYDVLITYIGVKPAITLSSEVQITGGDGSQSNPYTIE